MMIDRRFGGYWRDATFDEYLTRTIAATPGKVAVVADRADQTEARNITYAELGDLVARAAAALRRMDVKRGDVVAVQLPNWWEFVVASLAVNRIGAVVNPLMPIFRERELGYMLEFAEAKTLIVPKVYRGFDYEAMAMSMKPALPNLKHVVVVGGDGANAFDALMLGNLACRSARFGA
jgi:cyclohexanecarboxylate-CoA ligase